MQSSITHSVLTDMLAQWDHEAYIQNILHWISRFPNMTNIMCNIKLSPTKQNHMYHLDTTKYTLQTQPLYPLTKYNIIRRLRTETSLNLDEFVRILKIGIVGDSK
ncbi:hypothetical protein V6Z11_D09G053800 [Gossypium hirsutum]